MFSNKFDFKRDFNAKMVEMYGRSLQQSHVTERYMVLGDMVREYASLHWKESKENVATVGSKQMYYFSMEFLMGRMLTNNLMNLGIYDYVKAGLDELGFNINELEELESDAGLGNGGLGRLAACFMDSLASTSLPGNGITLRYKYGFFKQKIVDGNQVELPDQWLNLGNVWEVRKPKHAVDIPFWGHVDIAQDPQTGRLKYIHRDAEYVKAVPYDMPMVGRGTSVTNTLRLWGAEASDRLPSNKDFHKYLIELDEITQNVYPDDSTEKGKYLRLKQQYFFVSAGLQAIVKAHLRNYDSMANFAEKLAIQMNDTHPVLAIPELMRILLDEHNFQWDDAWNIVTKTMGFTNHTVLSEALERWSVQQMSTLLPRIYMIIQEIDRRFNQHLLNLNYDRDFINRVQIIRDNQVHMANLAIVGSHSVNGVAALHSQILVEDLFKDFYRLWPEKFNNKTNGVAHRRWLTYSNPQLHELLVDTIGDDYVYEPDQLIKLLDYVDNKDVQARFMNIKQQRKQILIDYIKRELDIDVDINSIIDTQAKRLHAYKRQLLNALHIIYLIQKIREDKNFSMHPQTFIFAAKAAPSYVFAKKVIKLINNLSKIVEADERVNKFIKVVFIPNYNVSIAEILLNASDVSEQISTAGKEASGTGNMKFMMNGAITLGTYDGANVEIDSLVGPEDDIIFGLRVEDVREVLRKGYSANEQIEAKPHLKKVVNSLVDGSWADGDTEEFRIIFEELMFKNDEYLILADFDAYRNAQLEVQRRYQNKDEWARSMLVNIAKSGFFSSDRTIKEYAEDIWDIQPLK